MIRRLAFALGDFAIFLLPTTRAIWGRAMTAELNHIADDRAAVSYAAGCLVGAVIERAADFESQFRASVVAIALATSAFAIFHIMCATRGLGVLLGRPDGFLAAMDRTGLATPDVVANYHQAMPFVVACLFLLGIAYLAGACFLLAWKLRLFLVSCCTAFLCATTAVAIQLSVIWTLDGMPSEFVALILQSAAVPIILVWSNGRHVHAE